MTRNDVPDGRPGRLRPTAGPAHHRIMFTSFTHARMFAPLAAAFVALTASPAAAFQVLTLDAAGAPSCVEAPGCDPTVGPVCDGADTMTCTALTLPPGPDAVYFCVDPVYVRYCCSTDSPCPTIDGTVGHCVLPTAGDPSFGQGLCIYGLLPPPCLGTLGRTDAQIIAACFRPTLGSGSAPYGTVPWATGDCDGDGLGNGMDECVCDPSNLCTAVDAGVPELDAGPPVEVDAATPPPDAGPVGIDANLPPGTGLNFRGAGGCDATHTRGADGGPLTALLTVIGVLCLRPRRRSRGRRAFRGSSAHRSA